jgi:hypothetical protein
MATTPQGCSSRRWTTMGGFAGLSAGSGSVFPGPSASDRSAYRPLRSVTRLFTALIQLLAGLVVPSARSSMAGARRERRGHDDWAHDCCLAVGRCSEHSHAGELPRLIRCGCRGLSRPCYSSGSRSPLLMWIRRSLPARHLNRSSPPGLSPTSIVRSSLPQRAVSPFLLLTILLTIPVK